MEVLKKVEIFVAYKLWVLSVNLIKPQTYRRRSYRYTKLQYCIKVEIVYFTCYRLQSFHSGA